MTPLQHRPMNHRPLLLGALVACFVSLSSCATRMPREEREARIDTYTDSAGKYLGMQEWERAQDQAMKGLVLDEDNFLLRLYLGRALLQRGDTDSVLKAVYTLERLNPDGDFRVPLSLGAALERKGVAFLEAAEAVATGERYTDAADPLESAEDLRSTSREALKRSEAEYIKALEMQPTDTETLNGLVRVTALRGEYLDSLAWCEAIVNITKDDRKFWEERRSRANISPQEEERMTENILRLHRLEMAVHLHAATLLSGKLGDPSAALEQLGAIVAFDPSVAHVHSQRGQLLMELGRYEEAIAALQTYLSLTQDAFDHADVKRAFRLIGDSESALVRAGN